MQKSCILGLWITWLYTMWCVWYVWLHFH